MKKTFLIITGIVVMVVVLFVNAIENEPTGLNVGDLASDFNLKSTLGKQVSLTGYPNAKGFIVVFTCNTCPYAKLYEQRIMELDQKYASLGFPVIAINSNDVTKVPDDSMNDMIFRASEKGYTFPYVRDDSQEVAKAYGATKTPHVFVLNKESNTQFRVEYIGAIDDSPNEASEVKERYVEDAVNALIAGQKPVVTSKRAIGCTIKWKDA